MANGKSTPQACKEAEIHTQTYYRWRKEYGGLKVEQAKRLKVLEKENTRLKRLIAELSLEKQVLKGHCQRKLESLSYPMATGNYTALVDSTWQVQQRA